MKFKKLSKMVEMLINGTKYNFHTKHRCKLCTWGYIFDINNDNMKDLLKKYGDAKIRGFSIGGNALIIHVEAV